MTPNQHSFNVGARDKGERLLRVILVCSPGQDGLLKTENWNREMGRSCVSTYSSFKLLHFFALDNIDVGMYVAL